MTIERGRDLQQRRRATLAARVTIHACEVCRAAGRAALVAAALLGVCGWVTADAADRNSVPAATGSGGMSREAIKGGGPAAMPAGSQSECCHQFREFGRLEARTVWGRARSRSPSSDGAVTSFAGRQPLRAYADSRVREAKEAFFRGRYNRSRARLPENVEQWRSRPDIANPGPDLANFPNSAFTLPGGRAYVEISPFTFYGAARGQPSQFNAEYLLRYGLTDDIELRLFGNGVSWSGGAAGGWGFSPIAFDTKIQLWTEKTDYFLPAAGFEAYLLTQWLGTAPFNGGTQPSFTFNFDQSLPFEVDFEYNLGATRVQASDGQDVWEFSFQWAVQRDLFDEDFAVFAHGFYNAMSLPRLPNVTIPRGFYDKVAQNAVGAGFIWTANQRLAVYGQVSAGTTKFTPSMISMLGFAVSF